MKALSAGLIGLFLLFAAQLQAEDVLTKSMYELDDFYYACLSHNSSASLTSFASDNISLYRPAIQFDSERDTIWVKVFITIDLAAAATAQDELRAHGLRGLSRFGNIFTAKIPILVLPQLEQLAFVKSIEPTVPAGATARAASRSLPITAPEPFEKKK